MTTSIEWEATADESRLRRAFTAFAPLDRLTISYAVASGLVLLYRAFATSETFPRAALVGLLVAHALLVVLVVLASHARQQCRRLCFLAEWYPLIVLVAVYASVGLMNAPQRLAGLSYDQLVQRWEVLTFGRQVSHDWSRWNGFGMGALSWPLSLSYLSFFPLVLLAPAALWMRGAHERARQTIFGISLTFFVCYLAFLLFPVAGPQYTWGWPGTGTPIGWPARTIQSLLDHGDSWGSAFPSSHVAASMAAALLALRHWRQLGLILLPFAICILLGVVFFQVHYALDAVAGLVIAVAATWLTSVVFPVEASAP